MDSKLAFSETVFFYLTSLSVSKWPVLNLRKKWFPVMLGSRTVFRVKTDRGHKMSRQHEFILCQCSLCSSQRREIFVKSWAI